MTVSTNSIRKISRAQSKSPIVAPIPRSTSPVGNRITSEVKKQAPRLTAGINTNSRDYGKKDQPEDALGYSLAGWGV